MTTMRLSDVPANALPTRALRGHGIVELMDLSGTSFDEPFYDHSLVALCERSSPWKVLTSFESLTRLTRVEALAPPGLFIFNTGRCGSTLLGNMFKEHPAVRMIQEPGVVNRFLTDGRPVQPDGDDGRALRAIISSFGRTRRSLVAFYAAAWRAAVVAGLELSRTYGNRVHLRSYEQLRTRPDEVATFLAEEFGVPCPPEVVAAMASRKHVYSKDFGRSATFDPSGAHARSSLDDEDLAVTLEITGSVERLAAAQTTSFPGAD